MDDLKKRYKYVIVDEFQDTNKLQFDLINALSEIHNNITVVGDENQSIYGFRGAYKDSFTKFKEMFETTKDDYFTLDKSYRSPNAVLRLSHQLILNNNENAFLVKNADDRQGNKVKVYELNNVNEEARKIAEIVEQEIENGTSLSEICILIRTHKQANPIKQALESKRIPFISAGKTDLLQKPEVRTVISYLSILNNLMERTGTGEQSWWHLFHYNNLLHPSDSVKIGRYLKKNKVCIDLALLKDLEKIDLSENGKKIVNRIIYKLQEIISVSNKALPDLILDIFELSGLNRAFTHSRTNQNIEALMNLKNFYDLAENYYRTHSKDLSSFIDYLEILDDLGVNIDAAKIKDINAVRLMTIHAVKGLQFDTVIVSNLADNRFPVTRTSNEPLIPKEFLPHLKDYVDSLGIEDDDEIKNAIKEYEKDQLLYEERRLCYVAITRTKQRLFLTYARSYNKEIDSATPSIFLHELDYKNNDDVEFIEDKDEKCTLFAPTSKYESLKTLLKNQLIQALDSDNIDLFHIL